MSECNTSWLQSVGCVVLHEGKVLLGRHTYGNGNGKLILPGGYIETGELPQEAAIREIKEETDVTAKVEKMLGIRCSRKNWYILFLCSYVSGEAKPDLDENSEVLWIDIKEALNRADVPDMTKSAILKAISSEDKAFIDLSYKQGIETDKDYEYYTYLD